MLVVVLAYSSALKMEAVYSSEMSANLYQTVQHHILEILFIITAVRTTNSALLFHL
jgi:hypothetical protein